jgi:hypothetical protein
VRRRRGGRRGHEVGRVREKLAALLLAEGIDIDPYALRWQDGAYATAQWDCCKWFGDGKSVGRADRPDGFSVHVSSWDTMTECARYGIDLSHDSRDLPGTYEVSVRSVTACQRRGST